LAVHRFEGVVVSLPRYGSFDTDDTGRLILGDLAGDAERLAGDCAVSLS
jgi:hypothetical protein